MPGPLFRPFNSYELYRFGIFGAGDAEILAVFDALTYDSITYEMLEIKTGTGDGTQGRDSARYALNIEDLYFSVAAYEAAWNEGRNVQNEATYSEDLTNAAWVKTNGTATASIFTATSGNATCLQTLTKAASDRIYACTIGRVTGTGTVEITTDGGTTWVDITASVEATTKRFTCNKSAETDPEYGVRLVTSGDEVSFTYHQNEDATGRADLTTPSEYCPTDTVGAGDPSGYKVFSTANGNSVDFNVVTEGVGASFAEMPWHSSCPAATNAQVWSNDQTNDAWAKVNAIATQDQDGLDGYPNSACKLVDDSGGSTGVVQVRDVATVVSNESNCVIAYVKADQLDWMRIYTLDFDSATQTFFDLTNGVIGSDTADDSDIIDLGNGFFKCIAQFSSTTDLTGAIACSVAEASGDSHVDLDGTSSIIIGNIELHKNKTIAKVRGLPPIFTAGAAVSTTADDESFDLDNHDNTKGAYYFELRPRVSTTESGIQNENLIATSTNTTNAPAFARYGGASIRTHDGLNTASKGLTWIAGNTYKIGVIYDAVEGKMRVHAGGAWGTEQTYDGAYGLDAALSLFKSAIYPCDMRNLRRYDLDFSAAKDKIDELMITRLTADSFTDRLEDESGNYFTV